MSGSSDDDEDFGDTNLVTAAINRARETARKSDKSDETMSEMIFVNPFYEEQEKLNLSEDENSSLKGSFEIDSNHNENANMKTPPRLDQSRDDTFSPSDSYRGEHSKSFTCPDVKMSSCFSDKGSPSAGADFPLSFNGSSPSPNSIKEDLSYQSPNKFSFGDQDLKTPTRPDADSKLSSKGFSPGDGNMFLSSPNFSPEDTSSRSPNFTFYTNRAKTSLEKSKQKLEFFRSHLEASPVSPRSAPLESPKSATDVEKSSDSLSNASSSKASGSKLSVEGKVPESFTNKSKKKLQSFGKKLAGLVSSRSVPRDSPKSSTEDFVTFDSLSNTSSIHLSSSEEATTFPDRVREETLSTDSRSPSEESSKASLPQNTIVSSGILKMKEFLAKRNDDRAFSKKRALETPAATTKTAKKSKPTNLISPAISRPCRSVSSNQQNNNIVVLSDDDIQEENENNMINPYFQEPEMRSVTEEERTTGEEVNVVEKGSFEEGGDNIEEVLIEEGTTNETTEKETVPRRKKTEEWINNLVYKNQENLEKIVRADGVVVLRCIKCFAYYKRTNNKANQYAWAFGLTESRTWERFGEHLKTKNHGDAANRYKRATQEGNVLLKAFKIAADNNKSKFDGKMIEAKLQHCNIVRNLLASIKQRQSTRSIYSRLDCFDAYLKDMGEAVTEKKNLAAELAKSNPTDYRLGELEKYEKLEEAMPTLKIITGESQSKNFTNRSTKMRNIKLQLGETIFTDILINTQNSQLHSFASDGVEDIKVRHSLNLYLQSETPELGKTINYFGRIHYATGPMDADGETKLILEMINHCLAGFGGYVFAGVLDGPNVHFGEHHSVRTILGIALTRDFSHGSALAITHETKAIPEIRDVKVLLEDIGRDLRNSYQKQMEYRAVFASLEEAIVEFETCPSTRWSFLRKAAMKLILVLYQMFLFLENRSERHLGENGQPEDPTAVGRLKKLKCLKFITVLFLVVDILEPVNALNTKTQGRKGLISEKRYNVQVTIEHLEALKDNAGTFERKLLDLVDFTGDYPKLVFEKGEIILRKLPGHIIRSTRTTAEEDGIQSSIALSVFIKQFKKRACTRMQSEIKECLSKDSLANAFGIFDILMMPIANSKKLDSADRRDINVIANHFGDRFWVLKSFRDHTSRNGYMVKPVLQDPVIDKEAFILEFVAARNEIVKTYRYAVRRGDTLTRMDATGNDENVDGEEEFRDEEQTDGVFTQRDAYEEFVRRNQDNYPNLCIIVRHLLAHIPNSVDCERNASNLKLTLTKHRNRMEYDTLNAEMQVTENGPKPFTVDGEELVSKVADTVLKGGFSTADFKNNLKFMKNVE